jgi:hypothetical protein
MSRNFGLGLTCRRWWTKGLESDFKITGSPEDHCDIPYSFRAKTSDQLGQAILEG